MKRALLVTLVLILAACSGYRVPCELEKGQAAERYGAPERITRYQALGYTRDVWWYDSIGYSIAFLATDKGACRVSTYSTTRY